MKILRATEYAHLLLSLAVGEGGAALDATAGNGQDTCFLAALVGASGRVWAFDLQQAACDQTAQLLTQRGLRQRVTLHCANHADLAQYPIPPLDAAVFNLGWLPGGDHGLVTNSETTLPAVRAAFDLLKPEGSLVIVAYPGHAAGAAEYRALRSWLRELPAEQAAALEVGFPQKQQAPVVLALVKQATNVGNNGGKAANDKKSQT